MYHSIFTDVKCRVDHVPLNLVDARAFLVIQYRVSSQEPLGVLAKCRLRATRQAGNPWNLTRVTPAEESGHGTDLGQLHLQGRPSRFSGRTAFFGGWLRVDG